MNICFDISQICHHSFFPPNSYTIAVMLVLALNKKQSELNLICTLLSSVIISFLHNSKAFSDHKSIDNPYHVPNPEIRTEAVMAALALNKKQLELNLLCTFLSSVVIISFFHKSKAFSDHESIYNPYHVPNPEIRTEAVMQALALNKKQSMAPMPSKRVSAMYSPNRRSDQPQQLPTTVSGNGQRVLLSSDVQLYSIVNPVIY